MQSIIIVPWSSSLSSHSFTKTLCHVEVAHIWALLKRWTESVNLLSVWPHHTHQAKYHFCHIPLLSSRSRRWQWICSWTSWGKTAPARREERNRRMTSEQGPVQNQSIMVEASVYMHMLMFVFWLRSSLILKSCKLSCFKYKDIN